METAPTTKIYCLSFCAPAHFGEDSSGLERTQEFVHSDTLYSAICYTWAKLFGPADLKAKLLEPTRDINNVPPLVLSSAFVYTTETFYLPKPRLQLSDGDFKQLENQPAMAKAFKDTSFVPYHMWKDWVSGYSFLDYVDKNTKTLKAYSDCFKKAAITRNYQRRNPHNTTPYFCQVVTFAKDSGLYFIARFNNPDLQPSFEKVLEQLGEDGLGGERSSGYGVFARNKDRETQINLESLLGTPVNNPKGFITLSLASPDSLLGYNDEAADSDDSTPQLKGWDYELVRRRGYPSPLGSRYGQRPRQSLVLLREGSVYRGAHSPRGRLWNVTPLSGQSRDSRDENQPNYRSGLALTWGYFSFKE